MQTVVFIVVAVALYFFSDWLLRQIERRLGRRLEYRTLYFFFILLALALAAFHLIGRFF